LLEIITHARIDEEKLEKRKIHDRTGKNKEQ
jgi:hypothetical protein